MIDPKIRAKQLADAHKDPIVVISSSTSSLNHKEQLASFVCSHCDTQFATTASTEPFCINCGSEEVTVDETVTDAPAFITDEDQMTDVVCSKCHSHNIMSDAVVASLGGSVHCTVCGTDLTLLDVVPEVVAVEPSPADYDALDLVGMNPAEVNEIQPGAVDAEEIPVEMLDVLPLDAPVSVVPMSDDLMAICLDNTPVATLDSEDAGENASIFGQEAFAKAIMHTISTVGLKVAIANYKFKPVVVAFPLKKVIESRVEALLEIRSSVVKAQTDTLSSDMEQCLSLAVAGLSSNFFKGKSNPTKEALVAELTSMGYKNANKLVSKVIFATREDYSKAVLSQTRELMAKSVEVRNQLAETMDEISPVVPEGDDTTNAVEARLSRPMIQAATTNIEAAPVKGLIRSLASSFGKSQMSVFSNKGN